jgi:beta-phosphoglucomutase-like phosphatase (HAD superfamily)
VQYEAFFFDFDGVLVDSVEVKTRGFAKSLIIIVVMVE